MILLTGHTLSAQIFLQGKVVDVSTKEPLTGATVRGVGSGEGTYTDDFGKFNLRTFAEELLISYIGYEQMTIRNFHDGDNLLIELAPMEMTLKEAVVVARAEPVTLRIPAPLMRIPAQALERDPDVLIAPALNRVTGVYMQSGALNTNRITIRGVGNRSPFATAKIRAYLDDIPLTSGVGETALEDIDLSIIDEVTVWKGPTASSYGAGLGGMIQLKTRKDRSGEHSSLKLYGLSGSYGMARGVAELDYISPDQRTNLFLNYNRTHSDGYRENNQYDRASLTAFGNVRSNDRDETSFLVNYTDAKAFIPSSINQATFDKNPRAAAANWAAIRGFEDYQRTLIGLSHRHDFLRKPHGKTLSNRTTLFSSFRNAYEPRPFNILREDSRALGFRSTLEYRNTFKRALPNLVLGGEFFQERYDWQTNQILEGATLGALLSDNEEVRQYYNLFAEANYDITHALFMSAGVNFNQTYYDLSDRFLVDGNDLSGRQTFDAVLSPRLGLGMYLMSRLMAFATVSHGFSPPTLEETLAPDGSINPDIQPERGWNIEWGLRADNFIDRLTLELTWFRMRIKDLLVARRTAEDQYIGINAGSTIHNGMEVFARYRLGRDLHLWGSYTRARYRFDEFVDREADYSGNALTGQPPHHVTAGLDLRLNWGLYAFLNYEFVDAYPLNDANTVYNGAYQLLNLKIGYRRALSPRFTLDLFAGANNLTDTKYAAMTQINAAGFGGQAPRYFYPGLPRNYYGGLRLEYGLLGKTKTGKPAQGK